MNSRQLIITAVAAILMTLSNSVAAENENEPPQEHNGYPDYQIKASYNYAEDRGKYHSPNTFVQSSQGDNGNNGKKGKRHSDSDRLNEESDWYRPWSWYNTPDKDDDNNQNSNRQSDPDSTRGQARAEERRGDKDHQEIERSWYDPRGWF